MLWLVAVIVLIVIMEINNLFSSKIMLKMENRTNKNISIILKLCILILSVNLLNDPPKNLIAIFLALALWTNVNCAVNQWFKNTVKEKKLVKHKILIYLKKHLKIDLCNQKTRNTKIINKPLFNKIILQYRMQP
jgi:hypothetical protein